MEDDASMVVCHLDFIYFISKQLFKDIRRRRINGVKVLLLGVIGMHQCPRLLQPCIPSLCEVVRTLCMYCVVSETLGIAARLPHFCRLYSIAHMPM